MKDFFYTSEIDFNKLKPIIQKNKDKIIVFSSNDDKLNRKVLEKLSINILLINLENKKDFQKQRNSGFNTVMAKIAKKKNIIIGINLDELISSNNKSKLISRLKQNIKLCKKNKLRMTFIQTENKRNLHDLKSLGLILGMPTDMTKDI